MSVERVDGKPADLDRDVHKYLLMRGLKSESATGIQWTNLSEFVEDIVGHNPKTYSQSQIKWRLRTPSSHVVCCSCKKVR